MKSIRINLGVGRVYLGINKPGSRENQLYIIKNQDSLELYRNPDFEEDPIPIKMIPQKSGDYLVLRTGKNHFRLIKDGRISRPIKVEGLNTEPEEYHICNGRAYWNDGGLNLRFAEIDEEGAFDYTGVEEGHIKQHKLTEKAEEIQIHPEIKRQDYIIEEIVSNHGNLFVYERKHGSGNEDNRVAIIRDGRVIGEKHKGIHFRMLGSTEHTLYGKKQHNVFTRYRLQPRG